MCTHTDNKQDPQKGNCKDCEKQAIFLLRSFSKVCKDLTEELRNKNNIEINKEVANISKKASVSVKKVVYYGWEGDKKCP